MGEPFRLTPLGLGIGWPPLPAFPAPVGVPAAPPPPEPIDRPAGASDSQAAIRKDKHPSPKPNPRTTLVKASTTCPREDDVILPAVCIFITVGAFRRQFETISRHPFRSRRSGLVCVGAGWRPPGHATRRHVAAAARKFGIGVASRYEDLRAVWAR